MMGTARSRGRRLFSHWLPISGMAAFVTISLVLAETSEIKTSPIIVRAKRPSETATEVNVTRQAVRDEQDRTLSDSLADLPSVSVTAQRGEAAPGWISIRGQDPSQTRYFLESIPLTDSELPRSSLHLLPTESYRQIDLYPSAPPARLLCDGFGGAIDIRQGIADGKQRFSAGVGSFDYVRAYSKVALGRQEIGIDLARSRERFSYIDSKGTPFNSVDDVDAERERNGFWRVGVFPSLTWRETANVRTRSLGVFSLGETELPGSTLQPLSHKLRENFGLFSLVDERSWSHSSLRSTFYFRRHEENLSGDLPLSSWIPARTLSQALGAKANYVKRWGPWEGEFSLGSQWDRYSPETTASAVNHQKWSVPLAVSGQWEFHPDWKFQSTLLAQWNRYVADRDPRFYSSLVATPLSDKESWLFSPRLSLQTRKGWGEEGELMSQLSGGYFQRGPSLAELYGSTWGMSPSPQLTQESAWKAEWEIQFKRTFRGQMIRRWQVGYAFHASRASDLIAYVPSSPQTYSSVNVGEALIYGHELQSRLEFPHGLYVKGWLALLDATNLTDSLSLRNRRLPFRSDRMRFDVGMERDRFSVGYFVEVVGSRAANLNNSEMIDSYSEHSLFAAVAVKDAGAFSLAVRNLWDQKQVDARMGSVPIREMTSGMPGYPSPGRKIYLTWRYAL